MAPRRKKTIKTKHKRIKSPSIPARRKKSPARKLPSRNTARRKLDPATGQELSRRQFEKKYGRAKKNYKKSSPKKFQHKIDLYKSIRDDYIEKNRDKFLRNKKYLTKDGRISRRAVMDSEGMKKIIRGLHSKNARVKARALEKTGRITRDQIELYVQKFGGETKEEGEDDE